MSPTLGKVEVKDVEASSVFTDPSGRIRRRRLHATPPWYQLPAVHLAVKQAFVLELGGGVTLDDVQISCFDTIAVCGGPSNRRRLHDIGDIIAKMGAVWETKRT